MTKEQPQANLNSKTNAANLTQSVLTAQFISSSTKLNKKENRKVLK